MVYVKKIFGRAGTGKTYTLTREIEALLNEGASIRNVAMVTHTRAGANVFKGRMINELGLDGNDLRYFGTMHSLSWRRQGLRKDQIFGKPEEQDFLETYYPDMQFEVPDEYPEEEFYLDSRDKARLSGNSKIRAMEEIDGVLSGCMITDFDFVKMNKMTGQDLRYISWQVKATEWSAKHSKHVLKWHQQSDWINEDEQIDFSKNFHEYLVQNNLFSHARNLAEMYETKSYLPVKYLFFDEFQDFSKLQYEIYLNWIAAPGVERVVIAGDDAQTIFRFSSADAHYLIETHADEVIKLGRTFRHGKVILDNANAILDHMRVVEHVGVEPAKDMDGEVIRCYGEEWKDVVDFTDPDKSVLVLASTGKWVGWVKANLQELFPDIVFVNIEDTRLVDRVFGMYNVIAALERGEEVQGESHDWDDAYECVAGLFKHSSSLPMKMFYNPAQTTLDVVDVQPILMNVLKYGLKKKIKHDEFPIRETYTKETFEEDFLKVPWIGKYLVNAIPDIGIFPQAPDVFPTYAEPKANKRIGTIHKSKGDEADTVLLFMSISQPALRHIGDRDVADDVLRQFYVGKTRPRTKLIEVYDYLRYSNGETAPAPLEVIL